jgi:hypothetical protein
MSQQPPEVTTMVEEQRPKTREIILVNRSEKQPASLWNRVEQISRIAAAVAVPVILWIGSSWIQNALSERSVNKDYVALAVSILAKSDKEVDAGLRKWAVDLLNANSPVKFDPTTSQKLSTGEIKLPEIKVPLSDTQFRPIAELPENSPLRNVSRSIGLLKIIANDGATYVCSAALISDDYVLTADFCVKDSPSKITLEMGASNAGQGTEYDVDVKSLESSVQLGYAILKVNGNPGATFGRLTLATNPVSVNDELFLAHYAYGKTESFSNQCRITKILDDSSFLHNCDTGGGVSGAPLIRLSDLAVVGIHHSRAPDDTNLKIAKRIDAIQKSSALLK